MDAYTVININIISIHSPHARGDKIQRIDDLRIDISIHSPHARGDTLTA